MRTLSFFMDCALPKELNPNWQPTNGPGLKFLRARAITQLKAFAYPCAVDARNRWERAHGNTRWEPLDKAEITVTIILGPRQEKWDETNIRAALKYAEDMWTMETARKRGADLIVDDSSEYVTWNKIQWEHGKKAGIQVEIKEVL